MRRLFVTGCLMLMLQGTAPAQDDAWLTALYQPVPGGYRYYLTVHNGMAPESNCYIFDVNARLLRGCIRMMLSPAPVVAVSQASSCAASDKACSGFGAADPPRAARRLI